MILHFEYSFPVLFGSRPNVCLVPFFCVTVCRTFCTVKLWPQNCVNCLLNLISFCMRMKRPISKPTVSDWGSISKFVLFLEHIYQMQEKNRFCVQFNVCLFSLIIFFSRENLKLLWRVFFLFKFFRWRIFKYNFFCGNIFRDANFFANSFFFWGNILGANFFT